MSYFFLPLIHAVELHLRRDDEKFRQFAEIIVFSFFASYVLYFLLPAIGPRFTLHDFNSLSSDLPGLWLTEFFRGIVNGGEGIPAGIANPALWVNRDCMPSGHTWMTLVNIILAFRFKSKWRWFFLIVGSSLIFATVYLRYHYVIDVLAGAAFALLSIKFEPKLSEAIKKRGLFSGRT